MGLELAGQFSFIKDARDEILGAVENPGDLSGIITFGLEQGTLQKQANFGLFFHEERVLIKKKPDLAKRIGFSQQGTSDCVLPVLANAVQDSFEQSVLAIEVPIYGALSNAGGFGDVGD
jgi:hypothetical protein